MWQCRVYFHSLLPTLRKVRIATTADSFQSAAAEILKYRTISQQELVHVLQSLERQYQSHGFYNSKVTSYLVDLLRERRDLGVFARVAALESLVHIAPQGQTSLYKSLFKDAVSALNQSLLHELTPEMSEQLLFIATNLKVRDDALFDRIKKLIVNSVMPQGILTKSFICSLLKASGELNADISDLGALIDETIALRVGNMSQEEVCQTAFYLSRIGRFEKDVWVKGLLPRLTVQNIAEMSEVQVNLIHYTLLAIDFYAGNLHAAIATQLPTYREFRSNLLTAVQLLKSHSVPPPPSSFLQDVISICDSLSIQYQLEYTTPSPTLLTVDMRLSTGQLLEVQGPSHYIEDSEELDGRTAFKNSILKTAGFEVREIPFFVWGRLGEVEKKRFVGEIVGRVRSV